MGAGALLARYDALICDIWGVLHDGRTAYLEAVDALQRYRAGGGCVLLLSNAPFPHIRVAEVLREKNVPDDSWDAIVSSGDITIAHVRERGYQRLHHLGPLPRDRMLFERLAGAAVALEHAQALVVSGLLDDRTETAEDYRELLRQALGRQLPLICANPDLVVDVGGTLLPCAGAIAALYAELGGEVFWAGKPHATAYRAAIEALARLRPATVVTAKILAIGDSLRTDIAGASAAGLDSLFIGHGIHRHEVMVNGAIDAVALQQLAIAAACRPTAAVAGLRW